MPRSVFLAENKLQVGRAKVWDSKARTPKLGSLIIGEKPGPVFLKSQTFSKARTRLKSLNLLVLAEIGRQLQALLSQGSK